MEVLIVDTETTGLPVRGDEYSIEQPWPVQLGAVLFDLKSGDVIEERSTLVVPPMGAVFNPRAVEVHGLSEERVRAEGQDIVDVMLDLQGLARRATIIGAYNLAFDERIIRTSSVRAHPEFKENPVLGPHATHLCVMNQATKHFGGRMKLVSVYRKLTGKPIEGAHDALTDAKAAATVFRILTARSFQK